MDFLQIADRLLAAIGTQKVMLAAVREDYRSLVDRFFVLPESKLLAEILREAFFATLMTYEGEPTRFVLSILPETQDGDIASSELTLADPPDCTRAAIRRLARVAPVETSGLRLSILGDRAVIRTILSYGGHFGRPVALSIAGLRPGGLSISFNNQRLMVIDGDSVTVDNDRLHIDAERAVNLLVMHQAEGTDARRRAAALALWDAAQVLRRERRGGAFWLLNSQSVSSFEGKFDRLSSVGALWAPIEKAEEPGYALFRDLRTADGERALRDLEDHAIANTLAQLASVDGAVLMTLAPRLVGFGSFVHQQPPSLVSRRGEGESSVVGVSELGGGRHQSAAAFCNGGRRGERAAIVVSQDGRVSLFLSLPENPGALGVIGASESVFVVHVARVGRGFAADE